MKTVSDAKRYADLDGNVLPFSPCKVWTQSELDECENILLKCSTNKGGPILAPPVSFPVPNTMAETHSKRGFFQLGQLVTIKCSTQAKSHDPEDPGIVIDMNDRERAIVYSLNSRRVVLVYHAQLAAPRFLAPLTFSMAEILSEDILNHVRQENHRRSDKARHELHDEAFPPLRRPTSTGDNRTSTPESDSEISALGTPNPPVGEKD
jgi:hypothetical protein